MRLSSCALTASLTLLPLLTLLLGSFLGPDRDCSSYLRNLAFTFPFNSSAHHFQIGPDGRLRYNRGIGWTHRCHAHFRDTFDDTSDDASESRRRSLQYGGYSYASVGSDSASGDDVESSLGAAMWKAPH